MIFLYETRLLENTRRARQILSGGLYRQERLLKNEMLMFGNN
jgi:hypothetical protein